MTAYNIKTDFGAVGDGTTDDAQAFIDAGNALYQTSGHELYLPTGTYKFGSNPITGGRGLGNSTLFLFEGVTQVLIRGDGSASTTINLNGLCNQLAGHGEKQNGNNYCKIASVTKGANTVTVLNLSDLSKIAVNQYIKIASLNIQDGYSSPAYPAGYGYPSNHQFVDYVKITAIDGGTGVVTFTPALNNTHLSTFPELNVGNNFEVNAGGPAMIYSLPLTWDMDIEWRGITFADAISNARIYNGGRKVVYRDCAFPNIAPIPSQNETWAVYDSSSSVTFTEVDKEVTNMVIDSSDWGTLDFQSSSIDNVTLTNSTLRGLVGGGYDTVVDGCVFTPGYVSPGAFAYGVSNSLRITNSEINEWRFGGFTERGPSDLGISPFWDMVDGVIKMPNGISAEFAVTDNGAGKCRYEVDNTGGLTVGKKIYSHSANQELVTTAQTTSGNNVLTFASVPGWIASGVVVRNSDEGYAGIAPGTTVASKTSTTVTLSANVTSTINIGREIAFRCPTFDDVAAEILAIPDSTHVDVDINLPTGFVWGWGFFGSGSAARWASPGKYAYFNATSSGAAGPARVFKILSITQDDDYTYIQTDQTGGWPTIPTDSRGVMLSTVPACAIYASNLTGSAKEITQLMQPAAQGKPWGSYFKHTYTGSDPGVGTRLLGNLVSIKVNVTKIYTGVAANVFMHLNAFDIQPFLVDGVYAALGWGFNLKQLGERIILPTDTVSNSTQKTGDSNLIVPSWSDSLWMNSTGTGYVLKNTAAYNSGSLVTISGEDPSVWPEVTVEITTDQNIFPDFVMPLAVVPLRLRLYA